VPLVGNKRATLIVLLFCLCIFVSTSGIALASSENWVDVKSFTGKETIDIITEPFTCDHVEWRIRWNYSPDFRMHGKPSFASFEVNVFENESDNLVSRIGRFSNVSESGTLSLSENGTFFLHIEAFFVDGYSIIVEQNLESIPEFPSWIIMPLLVGAALAVTVASNKLARKG
jgi:hypothetical protein